MATPRKPDNQAARAALFVGLALAAAALLTWSVLPSIWRISGSDQTEEVTVRVKDKARPTAAEPMLPLPPPLVRMKTRSAPLPPQPLPLPTPVVALPAEPEPIRDEGRGFSFAIAPVQRAIRETLESGDAERWRHRDARGYAVASAIERGGGQVCRNVYATAEAGGGEYRSPTWTYCRTRGGWARR
ncbi:MAG: hypothetical protein ACT4OE_11115 [Sphingosinicella sp.]